jgi:hypothetical protein
MPFVVNGSFRDLETAQNSSALCLGLLSLCIARGYAERFRSGVLEKALGLAAILMILVIMVDKQGRVLFGADPTTRGPHHVDNGDLGSFEGNAGITTAIARSEQLRLRARGSDGGAFVVENLDGGPAFRRERVSEGHRIDALIFSPDGTTLAVADNPLTRQESEITIWNVQPGGEGKAPVVTLRHRLAVTGHSTYALAIFPDGGRLVSCRSHWHVRLWDIQSGKELEHFCPHGEDAEWTPVVEVVVVSPDGTRIATWGRGDMRLWGLGPLRLLRIFDDHRRWRLAPLRLELSPDGRSLIAQDVRYQSRWDLDPSPVPFIALVGTTGVLCGWLLLTAHGSKTT